MKLVLEEPYINNVRTAATPNVLKELAQMEGWSNPDPKGKAADGRVTEGFFAPRPEVPEGKWEIGVVLSQKFDQDVRRVCMALPKPWDPAEAFYQSRCSSHKRTPEFIRLIHSPHLAQFRRNGSRWSLPFKIMDQMISRAHCAWTCGTRGCLDMPLASNPPPTISCGVLQFAAKR